MSDLRDQTHPPAVNADHRIFLDYHENSPYAQAKVKSGLVLNPEARVYMENEIAERKLREKLYQDRLAAEKAALNGTGENNGQQQGPHAGQDERHAQSGHDVQRSGQPHDAGDGADLQRAPGQGSGSQGQGGSADQTQQGRADLSADAATGPAAGNTKLA